ncbi:MAG: MFS transporter [Dehalococcoidia bacterium]|nr:MFS transporter [Dehalococcoidia bacterium]
MRLIPRLGAPSLFRARGYLAVWLGAVGYSFGMWSQRVAVGWYVFDATDSAFITAGATAAASAPAVFVGPIAGAIADRSPRPLILALAAVANGLALAGIALLAVLFKAPVAGILVLVTVGGVGRTFNLSALHTLSGDLAGPERRASAISLVSLGQRAVAALGAVGSGLVIAYAGAATAFALGVVAYALAALAYRAAREPAERRGRPAASLLADTLEGLSLVTRFRMVALLLGLMVVAEVLGFSYDSLLPALADRVLAVGASGLGGIVGAAGIGSVGGTLFLVITGDRVRHGRLFIGVLAAFGVLLVLLGSSSVYAVSLAIAAGIGACAAMVDALQWIMLQASVPDHLRGRALGAWNVAIGFGWIGPLALGALADATSVGVSLSAAGSVLVATGVLVALSSPRLRAA